LHVRFRALRRNACGNLGPMVGASPKDRQRALALSDKAWSLGDPDSRPGTAAIATMRAIWLLERVLILDPKTSSAAEAEKALALARPPAKDPEDIRRANHERYTA